MDGCVKTADRPAAREEARIDVDALVLVTKRLEGKLPPEDIAYLRALTALLADVREELCTSDASMDRVRHLMRGVRGVSK
jgi:hypothetical protein